MSWQESCFNTRWRYWILSFLDVSHTRDATRSVQHIWFELAGFCKEWAARLVFNPSNVNNFTQFLQRAARSKSDFFYKTSQSTRLCNFTYRPWFLPYWRYKEKSLFVNEQYRNHLGTGTWYLLGATISFVLPRCQRTCALIRRMERHDTWIWACSHHSGWRWPPQTGSSSTRRTRYSKQLQVWRNSRPALP